MCICVTLAGRRSQGYHTLKRNSDANKGVGEGLMTADDGKRVDVVATSQKTHTKTNSDTHTHAHTNGQNVVYAFGIRVIDGGSPMSMSLASRS